MQVPALRSAAVLAALLVPAAPEPACGQASKPARSSRAAAPAAPPAVPASLAELSAALEGLAVRVGPSVVQILSTGYAPAGGGRSGVLAKQRSSGSGVILDPGGYIVTNNHVVRGARRLQVVLPSAAGSGLASILRPAGRTVGAQVVGVDPETDLAVIKVEETDLPALPLGDSEVLRQGQIVLAFGAPLGLDNSATLGVVSAVARQLEPESPMIYVQTDAPINPGNSGGPLVDVEGRVVGINTMMLSQGGGNEGLGFAVPSNIVKNVYDQLRKTGRVNRGTIGVRAQTITRALAGGMGLSRTYGVIVTDVSPLGGAAEAGVERGDVVLTLDGKPMENARQLEVNLYRRAPGESVVLELLRGDQPVKAVVTVAERPRDPSTLGLMVTPEGNQVPRLGILALDLDDTLIRLLPPLRARAGVVVAVNTGEGPAWPDEPEAGDVVYAVNRQPVRSVDGLRAEVAKLKHGDPVVLLVERRGELHLLAAEME